jgi:5-dehydro-4-deoxyglucarate dehydratase
MQPSELRELLRSGLLSFPVTDFTPQGDFEPHGYAARLDWLAPFGASALFAAGGTGEFFSLAPADYTAVVRTAVEAGRGRVPIIAGAGGATRVAIDCAREAERLGAAGVLLLPHYLTEAPQDGVAAHVEAVCRSVGVGVIVYNRGPCRLTAAHLERLADRCSNLVGFKDGLGDIELMVAIRRRLGDRFAYLGGLPTAEVYAAAYRAMGVPVYSSAVFNFVPRTAIEFYRAVAAGDEATTGRLLDGFFLPLIELRGRAPGYAVSMIKAGCRIVGRDAGPVRPPLVELTPDEVERLAALVESLGPQS